MVGGGEGGGLEEGDDEVKLAKKQAALALASSSCKDGVEMKDVV